MRRFFPLLSLVITFSFAQLYYCFDHSHYQFTKVLKKYQVKNSYVQYKKLQADVKKNKKHPLTKYLKSLTAVKKAQYKKWSNNKKMAFLINAYNAFTLQLIIDNYPVDSIKDTVGFLRSPWQKEFLSLLAGDIKKLDTI